MKEKKVLDPSIDKKGFFVSFYSNCQLDSFFFL